MLSLLDILRQEIEEAFADVPLPPDNNWIVRTCFSAAEREGYMNILRTRIVDGKILPIANEREEQGWSMMMGFCSENLFYYTAPRLMLETLRDNYKLGDGTPSSWLPFSLFSSFSSFAEPHGVMKFTVSQKRAICHWAEHTAAAAETNDDLSLPDESYIQIVKTWSPQIPNYKPLFSPQPS